MDDDVEKFVDVPMGSRPLFARRHLLAASLMAYHCRALESEFVAAGADVPSRRVESYAIAAITESVSFLEALVNELWQYAIDSDAATNPNLWGLPPGTIEQIRRLDRYDRVERALAVLEKFDLVLMCAGKPGLDSSRTPHRDVKLLIQLRNAIVHYRPRMQWSNQLHKLQKPLTDLGLENPLHEGLMPWFPGYPLCASVAEWSWTKSRDLAYGWQQALGLEHPTVLSVSSYSGGAAPDAR